MILHVLACLYVYKKVSIFTQFLMWVFINPLIFCRHTYLLQNILKVCFHASQSAAAFCYSVCEPCVCLFALNWSYLFFHQFWSITDFSLSATNRACIYIYWCQWYLTPSGHVSRYGNYRWSILEPGSTELYFLDSHIRTFFCFLPCTFLWFSVFFILNLYRIPCI